jgi:heme A synthase
VGNHSRYRADFSFDGHVARDSRIVKTLRKLSLAALILAFAQIVFGAIVRITGSGMGCGDHWPKCQGAWFPPHDRIDLIIEITHRYIALALTLTIIALFVAAFRARSNREASGVFAPATTAAVLVVIAALLGAVTVKMALNPFVIATHLTIAMSLLATLALALSRAGGLGANADMTGATERTFRAARGAVGLTLVVLIFGALTANVPDAASSCGGFPLCRTITAHGLPLWIQVTHRILAVLLLGHLTGVTIATGKRKEPAVIRRAARFTLGAAILQIFVAAAMIEMHFPPAFRSLHQAFGTLVWLSVVILAILSARGITRTAVSPALREAA